MPAVRVLWPQYLVIAATAFPLVGAAAARRLSWRDPVGQLGLAWGAMFAVNLLQLAAVRAGRFTYVGSGNAVVALLSLLLVPPLLTWMGPGAKRWQTPLLVLLVLAWVGAVLAVGTRGRGIGLVYKSPVALLLAALALGTLIAQARRAADPQGAPAEPGWVWIGAGHLLYFLALVIGRAMIEFAFLVVGRSGSRDANMGLLLVYTATLAAIAWGQWKGRRTDAQSPAARIAA
jgi:hypothetical protein